MICGVNKQWVAKSFGQAARSYDSVARLQRRVGDQLLMQLQTVLNTDAWEQRDEAITVMDLGCGTGALTQKLAEVVNTHCPAICTLVGLDLSYGMLDFARREQESLPITWLQGDGEQLPLADHSVDILFSSLALQWCEPTVALAAELRRVLKPDGYFVFSTLAEHTLAELRSAWSAVDSFQHVNTFSSAECWQQVFSEVDFDFEYVSHHREVLYYDDFYHLARELKGLGAHNMNQGRKAGLTTKTELNRVITAYEAYRHPEGLPASWEVVLGVAVPAPDSASGTLFSPKELIDGP